MARIRTAGARGDAGPKARLTVWTISTLRTRGDGRRYRSQSLSIACNSLHLREASLHFLSVLLHATGQNFHGA